MIGYAVLNSMPNITSDFFGGSTIGKCGIESFCLSLGSLNYWPTFDKVVTSSVCPKTIYSGTGKSSFSTGLGAGISGFSFNFSVSTDNAVTSSFNPTFSKFV